MLAGGFGRGVAGGGNGDCLPRYLLAADGADYDFFVAAVFGAGGLFFVVDLRLTGRVIGLGDGYELAGELLAADLALDDPDVAAFGKAGGRDFVFLCRVALLVACRQRGTVGMHAALQADVFGLAVLGAGSLLIYERVCVIILVRSVRVALPEAGQLIRRVAYLLGESRGLSGVAESVRDHFREASARSVAVGCDGGNHGHGSQNSRSGPQGRAEELLQQGITVALAFFGAHVDAGVFALGGPALEDIFFPAGDGRFLKESDVRVDRIVFGQRGMLRSYVVLRTLRKFFVVEVFFTHNCHRLKRIQVYHYYDRTRVCLQ